MAPPMRSEYVLFSVLLVFCLVPAVTGTGTVTTDTPQQYAGSLHLFRPASDSLPSTQVNAIVNGRQGNVLLATPLGLASYDGGWSTRHINRNNVSNGLLDNFVTALAYDSSGNLWIGYAGGLQIYDGSGYQLITDQQLLKSLQIRALQRWNDDMWIATGNSGLSRYSRDTWTWYAPYSPGGPGFYEADSMTLDTAANVLLVGTRQEGLWEVTGSDTTIRFIKIQDRNDPFGLFGQVRRDPLGGAYFFNATDVAHYSPAAGFTPVLSWEDFPGGPFSINDIAAGPGGEVYVATGNGIYVWQDGAVTRHLGTFEGFGTDAHNIKMVFVDARGRLWFSTMDVVGYYTGDVSTAPPITIETMTPTPTPVPPVVIPTTASVVTITPPPVNPSFIGSIRSFFGGIFGFMHPSS